MPNVQGGAARAVLARAHEAVRERVPLPASCRTVFECDAVETHDAWNADDALDALLETDEDYDAGGDDDASSVGAKGGRDGDAQVSIGARATCSAGTSERVQQSQPDRRLALSSPPARTLPPGREDSSHQS